MESQKLSVYASQRFRESIIELRSIVWVLMF